MAEAEVKARVSWRELVEAVLDIAQSEFVQDGEFAEYDAMRLEQAAAAIRSRIAK